MKVYSTGPARMSQSNWVTNTLATSIAACRFKNSVPSILLEPMPDGCMGYASNATFGHRISLSNRAIYWTESTLIRVAIHEYCHRLVMNFESESKSNIDAHGPEFFLVLMVLYSRIDSATGSEFFKILRLYDFSDVLPDREDIEDLINMKWQAVVLNFALMNFLNLANSCLFAEELPKKAHELWTNFLLECKNKDKEKQQSTQYLNQLENTTAVLQEQIAFFKMLVILLVLIVSMSITFWAIG